MDGFKQILAYLSRATCEELPDTLKKVQKFSSEHNKDCYRISKEAECYALMWHIAAEELKRLIDDFVIDKITPFPWHK